MVGDFGWEEHVTDRVVAGDTHDRLRIVDQGKHYSESFGIMGDHDTTSGRKVGMRQLEMKLNGEITNMDARALEDALSAVIRMLRSVSEEDEIVTLQDLKVASATVVFNAPNEAVKTIQVGMDSLRNEAVLPEGWNETTLTSLQALHKTENRTGVESIQIDIDEAMIAIDKELADHAKEAEGSGIKSLGSATGRLYRYSNKNNLEAALEDSRTERSIKLLLDDRFGSEVRSLLEKDVIVRGIIKRSIWDNRIIEIDVRGIQEDTTRTVLRRPAAEGRGILGADWLDGEDPTEWVRRLRDEA